MSASQLASVRSLREAGFRVTRIRQALSFKSVTTPEEMRAILKLRELDGAGRLPVGDRFDEFARKVLCRVGRRIVAACRLVFVEDYLARSEIFASAEALPPALTQDGFVEVSRLNWHASYSSPDKNLGIASYIR